MIKSIVKIQFKWLKFSWWSNWEDIATYSVGGSNYLVQIRCSRMNKKQFRQSLINKRFGVAFDFEVINNG